LNEEHKGGDTPNPRFNHAPTRKRKNGTTLFPMVQGGGFAGGNAKTGEKIWDGKKGDKKGWGKQTGKPGGQKNAGKETDPHPNIRQKKKNQRRREGKKRERGGGFEELGGSAKKGNATNLKRAKGIVTAKGRNNKEQHKHVLTNR